MYSGAAETEAYVSQNSSFITHNKNKHTGSDLSTENSHAETVCTEADLQLRLNTQVMHEHYERLRALNCKGDYRGTLPIRKHPPALGPP